MNHRYRGVNVGGERHIQRHINWPPSKSIVHPPPSKQGLPSFTLCMHCCQLASVSSQHHRSRFAFIDANLSLCRRNTSRRPGVTML